MPNQQLVYRRAHLRRIQKYPDGIYAIGYLKAELRNEDETYITMKFGKGCTIPVPEIMDQDFDLAYYAYKRQGGGNIRGPEIQNWTCWYLSPLKTRREHITNKSDSETVKTTIAQIIAAENEEWESGAIEMDDCLTKARSEEAEEAIAAAIATADAAITQHEQIQERRKQEAAALRPNHDYTPTRKAKEETPTRKAKEETPTRKAKEETPTRKAKEETPTQESTAEPLCGAGRMKKQTNNSKTRQERN